MIILTVIGEQSGTPMFTKVAFNKDYIRLIVDEGRSCAVSLLTIKNKIFILRNKALILRNKFQFITVNVSDSFDSIVKQLDK